MTKPVEKTGVAAEKGGKRLSGIGIYVGLGTCGLLLLLSLVLEDSTFLNFHEGSKTVLDYSLKIAAVIAGGTSIKHIAGAFSKKK